MSPALQKRIAIHDTPYTDQLDELIGWTWKCFGGVPITRIGVGPSLWARLWTERVETIWAMTLPNLLDILDDGILGTFSGVPIEALVSITGFTAVIHIPGTVDGEPITLDLELPS